MVNGLEHALHKNTVSGTSICFISTTQNFLSDMTVKFRGFASTSDRGLSGKMSFC